MTTQDIVTVTIKWEQDPATGQDVVVATPSVVEVTAGQTIRFRRARDGLEGTMRLTFEDKNFFDTGNPEFAATGVHEGNGDVRVNMIPSPTRCNCELLDARGRVIAQSSTGGVQVEPVKQAV
jgi:hypothetical protein